MIILVVIAIVAMIGVLAALRMSGICSREEERGKDGKID